MGRRVLRRGVLLAIILLVLCIGGTAAYQAWWNYRYPYGWSHCCDIGLYFALCEYAERHDGAFPSGEASPEASLSLLLRGEYGADANLLRGKTVPLEVVQEIVDAGGLLGPETCGWHYVEGLRKDDNPELALFWDKVGLGHNGERLPRGTHIVYLLRGHRWWVSGDEWEGFLETQRQLLEEQNLKRAQASP